MVGVGRVVGFCASDENAAFAIMADIDALPAVERVKVATLVQEKDHLTPKCPRSTFIFMSSLKGESLNS